MPRRTGTAQRKHFITKRTVPSVTHTVGLSETPVILCSSSLKCITQLEFPSTLQIWLANHLFFVQEHLIRHLMSSIISACPCFEASKIKNRSIKQRFGSYALLPFGIHTLVLYWRVSCTTGFSADQKGTLAQSTPLKTRWYLDSLDILPTWLRSY